MVPTEVVKEQMAVTAEVFLVFIPEVLILDDEGVQSVFHFHLRERRAKC
jgi:hypothetical protein